MFIGGGLAEKWTSFFSPPQGEGKSGMLFFVSQSHSKGGLFELLQLLALYKRHDGT